MENFSSYTSSSTPPFLAIIFIAIIFLISIFFFSFLWNYISSRHNNGVLSPIPINIPIFGMIPAVLLQLHRLPDYMAGILKQTQGTFIIKGPWFTKIELLLTADPSNVRYIMSKHHEDFNRGPNYHERLDILGDGLIISEFDKWKYQRKIAMASFSSTRFRQSIVETLQQKLEKGLIPLLDRSHKEGLVLDLQDIFTRLASDITFKLLIGYDTDYLSFNPSSHSVGMLSTHEAEDAVVMRHVLPDFLWKLQRRFGIGKERNYSEYAQAVDDFAFEMIKKKREEACEGAQESGEASQGAIDLISLYMEENYGASPDHGFKSTNVFLRDTFVNFLIAGKDTVSPAMSWFFWLLIKHPHVEAKIKEEIAEENNATGCEDISELGNPNNLVYLHAAICEAIRLYPSVPFVIRASKQLETLPSRHQVKPWTVIILGSYAMARMKWVWGEDCEEFKPERWMTEKGTIKHEPSHKFFSFNTGPKICLGKDIAFLEMKAVARHVISHGYRFEVVDGHRVEPASSAILWMKNGLKVKVMKNAET